MWIPADSVGFPVTPQLIPPTFSTNFLDSDLLTPSHPAQTVHRPMDHRHFSLQERTIRGSLPLKKRRLSLPLQVDGTSSFRHASAMLSPRPTLAVLPDRPATVSSMISASTSGSCGEKIAALALVAAAASSYSQMPLLPPLMADRSISPEQGMSLKARVLPTDNKFEEDEDSTSDESSDASTDGGRCSTFAANDHSRSQAKRTRFPPLSAPLPGGCHGRTSRKNSYCRRQPLYKGSDYCKLHYQQCVLSGTPTSLSANKDESSHRRSSTKKTSQPARVHASAPRETPLHQDRRFTGEAGQVRCSATTTRGRACAFISVNDSKYCHLHSDYDSNPPPRRGGASALNKNAAVISLAKGSLQSLESLPEAPPLEVCVSTSPPSVTSDESSRLSSPLPSEKPIKNPPKARGSRRTPSKLAEMHAESPYPLLSMLSTDQWYGKTVTISVGPMVGKVGTVEKWGNGWVSVNIPGEGYHNRRSFELYLHTEDEDGELSLKLQRSQDQSKSSLLRCVSRDDSPSSVGTATAKGRSKSFGETEEGPQRFNDSVPTHVVENPRPV